MCWKWRCVQIFLILLFLATLPVQSKIHLILAIDNSEATNKIDPNGYRWESAPLAIDQLQVGDGLEIINLSRPHQPLVNEKILTGHFSQKEQLKKNLDIPSKRHSEVNTKEGLQYLWDRLNNPTQYRDPLNPTGVIVLAYHTNQLDLRERNSATIEAISLKKLDLQTPVDLLTRVSQLLNQMHGYTVSVVQPITKPQPFDASSFLVHDPRIEEIQVQYLFKSSEELSAIEVRDALGEFVYHYAESKNLKLYTIPNPPLGNWKVTFQNLDQVSQVVSTRINDKLDLPELVFKKPEEKQWPIELRVQAEKSFESAGIAMHLDVIYATVRLPDNTDQQLQLTSVPSTSTPSFSTVYTPLENGDYYITIDPSTAYVVTPPRRLVKVVPAAKPDPLPFMLAVLVVVGAMATGGVMVLGAMRQSEQDNVEFFMSDDFADLELKEDDATTTSEKQADAFLDPKIAAPNDVEEFMANDAQTVATPTENMELIINTEADEDIADADLEEELEDLVGYDDILQLISGMHTSSEDDEDDLEGNNEADKIWQELNDSADDFDDFDDLSDSGDDNADLILDLDDEDDFDNLDDLDLGLDDSDVEGEKPSLSDTNDDEDALSPNRSDTAPISESPTTSIDAKDRASNPDKLASAANTLSSDLEATELEELPNEEDSLKLKSESNKNGINDLIANQSQVEDLKELLESQESILDSNDASEDDNIDPAEHNLALETGLEEKTNNENTNLLELIDSTADQESESSLLDDSDPIEKLETETSDLEVPGEESKQKADLVDQIDSEYPTDEPEPSEISAHTSAPADDLSLEDTTALGDGLSLEPVPAEQDADTNSTEVLSQRSSPDENDSGDDSSLDSIMDMVSDDDNDPLAALLAETEESSGDTSLEESPAEEEFHDLVEEWPELQAEKPEADAESSSVDEEFEEPNFESEPSANPIESVPDQLENEVADHLDPVDVTSVPVANANQIGAQLDNEPSEVSAHTSAPADDLSLEDTTALGDGLSLEPVPAEQDADTNSTEVLSQRSSPDENDSGDDSSLDSIMDMVSDDDNDPLAALLAETEESSGDTSLEESPAEEEFHDLVEEWPELQAEKPEADAESSSVDEEFEEPNFESEPSANPIESVPDQLENEVADHLDPVDVTSVPVANANQIGAQLDNEPSEVLEVMEPVRLASDQQTKEAEQPDDVEDEDLQNLLHQIEAISEDNSDQSAQNPTISDQTELRSRPLPRHRSRADRRRSSNRHSAQTSESEVSMSRPREAKKEQVASTDIDEVLAAIDRLRETD